MGWEHSSKAKEQSNKQKKMTTTHLNMPTEISAIIQDYLRINPNKAKWDNVVSQMRNYGQFTRFDAKNDMVWGEWVNSVSDDEWDIMVCNCVALPRIIETEGNNFQDEFCGMTIGETLIEQLWCSNDF